MSKNKNESTSEPTVEVFWIHTTEDGVRIKCPDALQRAIESSKRSVEILNERMRETYSDPVAASLLNAERPGAYQRALHGGPAPSVPEYTWSHSLADPDGNLGRQELWLYAGLNRVEVPCDEPLFRDEVLRYSLESPQELDLDTAIQCAKISLYRVLEHWRAIESRSEVIEILDRRLAMDEWEDRAVRKAEMDAIAAAEREAERKAAAKAKREHEAKREQHPLRRAFDRKMAAYDDTEERLFTLRGKPILCTFRQYQLETWAGPELARINARVDKAIANGTPFSRDVLYEDE